MPPIAEPVVFRPRRLRVVAGAFALGMCLLCAVGWFALPLSLRESFTAFQRLTLLAILAAMLFTLATMSASSVRADAQGLIIRNGLRTHRFRWQQVHKVMLRPGDSWALLLIRPADGSSFEIDLDAEKCQLMGIQANDGESAVRAVATLQDLHRSAQRAG